MYKLLLAVMLGLGACSSPVLVNQSFEIADGQWNLDQRPRLSFAVTDVETPYDFSLLVRHTGDYRWENIVVLCKTYHPDNHFTVDTLNCTLAATSGQWLGSGLGDVFDLEWTYRTAQRFQATGNYEIELEHGMRAQVVEGVLDVGIKISPTTDNE